VVYQSRMIDDDECGAVGRMRISRGNRSTRRKPTPVSLRPPQIPHGPTWARIRAATVGSRRLTAWDMALPDMVWTSTWSFTLWNASSGKIMIIMMVITIPSVSHQPGTVSARSTTRIILDYSNTVDRWLISCSGNVYRFDPASQRSPTKCLQDPYCHN
jgi:hypothetical protein